MPGRWVGRWMSWYGRRRRRGAIIDLLLSSSSSWISREVAALFVCLAVGRSLSLSLSHTHTHTYTHTLSPSLSPPNKQASTPPAWCRAAPRSSPSPKKP